jgi:hypothetical protein
VLSAGAGRCPNFDMLRVLARVGLADGRLFNVENHVRAGTGSGLRCVVCAMAIKSSEVEYEVTAPAATVYAHFACYLVWHQESRAARTRSQSLPAHDLL